jgi:hypothetical protein
MIPIGTLCLLVNPHSRAGSTCTVTSAPASLRALHVASGTLIEVEAYDVALGHPDGRAWVACANELVPICPPTDDQGRSTTRHAPVATREFDHE